LFNTARFTKLHLYLYLVKNKTLFKYLPPTTFCKDYNLVKRFINRYENVILKPANLSRGRGICIINRVNGIYLVSDYRRKPNLEIAINNDEELQAFFERNTDLFKGYLIQKRLELAKVDDQPYDIRIVMQKEKPQEWKCNGIECRVAAKKSLLTNISQGGFALTIDEALERSFNLTESQREDKKQELYSLCLSLCEHLDKMGHHFAEFGIDIAIDEDGTMWIIEANVFPSFKGFKLMDYKTYLNIRYAPMLYAASLAGFEYNAGGSDENYELFSNNKTPSI
jgi:glutathione synthase/RimK-type ligase-like ATP-grasp enzyme